MTNFFFYVVTWAEKGLKHGTRMRLHLKFKMKGKEDIEMNELPLHGKSLAEEELDRSHFEHAEKERVMNLEIDASIRKVSMLKINRTEYRSSYTWDPNEKAVLFQTFKSFLIFYRHFIGGLIISSKRIC